MWTLSFPRNDAAKRPFVSSSVSNGWTCATGVHGGRRKEYCALEPAVGFRAIGRRCGLIWLRGQDAMPNDSQRYDQQALRELNLRIGDAESQGDREWLASILAPKLAFQRADPARTVDDRDAFLQKVKPASARSTRIIEPIELYGDRAIVKCMVSVGEQQFHNLRLFVRRDGGWKLLAWANEAR